MKEKGGAALMEIIELIKILKDKKLKIATAESCTGGLLAKKITDVSGSSEVFEMGIVSYANRIKNEFLEVPSDVLNTVGAVSEETASQMAKGIINLAKADVGVGITGIAGPTGGTEEKPVGLVYISIYFKGRSIVKKLNLSGNREEIREQTTNIVIDEIGKVLTD